MSRTPVRDLFERLELVERLEAARSECHPGGDGDEVVAVILDGALEEIRNELELEQAALEARRSGKCPLCLRDGLWSTEYDTHLRATHGVEDR